MPYARLPERSLLAVTGEAAHHFLQNLVTADLDSLAEGEMRPCALLTPQGKILFEFLIGKQADGLRIDVATSAAADLKKRLTLYRLRTKIGIESPDLPVHAVWEEPDLTAAELHADRRFPEGEMARLYGTPPEGLAEASADDYRLRRIRAGIAEAETDYPGSDVFPHDVLFDQNGGVSFRKGCFVGQEVVSRMQHRGTARRRLMLLAGERHLTPGSNIEAGGKTIGTVLSADGTEGFGFLRIDRLAGALSRGDELSADGVPVTATIPPWAGFALPEPAGADGETAGSEA
ncbi:MULTISPECIES: CAF17-like 4Fe-4S cluster assembly/insertion protein YgfZ [Aurantimonas]|uniref:CAF17-like 4Fe-4S cluster assembly/insertion protein YgfZ n=1 Tax=Aurantimonas TaxID=182269 RepID=UPI0003FE1062|nr:folate-binding protein YgfZ [Aurantimonas coralicida]